MLKSLRTGGFALATATLCFAGAAQAANHTVFIVDGAYFPAVVHVAEGDNVYFTNNSEDGHVVTSANGEWTSGPLAIDARFRLKIREISDLSFSGTDASGAPLTDFDGNPMAGELTFEALPELE
jgi:plastocyanin